MIIVGVDLSVSSPALCIIRTDSKTSGRDITWWVRPGRKRDIPVQWKQGDDTFHIGFLLSWSDEKQEDEPSIAYHDRIALALVDRVPEHADWIGIETYLYSAQQTNCISILIEIGTLFRYHLWKKGLTPHELAVPTIKKAFTGSGRADKSDMEKAFRIQHHLPDLYQAMYYTRSTNPQTVKHPIEDMVDSYAICYTHLVRSEKIDSSESDADPSLSSVSSSP